MGDTSQMMDDLNLDDVLPEEPEKVKYYITPSGERVKEGDILYDDVDTGGLTLKAVFLGDGGIGKTCMLLSYLRNDFPKDYVPTVFDDYSHAVLGLPILLVDTAGQEDFDELRPLSYEGAHLFIYCYNVTRRDSYKNVFSRWIPEVHDFIKDHGMPLDLGRLVIGTKRDLRDPEKPENDVSREEGEALANKLGVKYFECSALQQETLGQIFDHLAERFGDYLVESKRVTRADIVGAKRTVGKDAIKGLLTEDGLPAGPPLEKKNDGANQSARPRTPSTAAGPRPVEGRRSTDRRPVPTPVPHGRKNSKKIQGNSHMELDPPVRRRRPEPRKAEPEKKKKKKGNCVVF